MQEFYIGNFLDFWIDLHYLTFKDFFCSYCSQFLSLSPIPWLTDQFHLEISIYYHFMFERFLYLVDLLTRVWPGKGSDVVFSTLGNYS